MEIETKFGVRISYNDEEEQYRFKSKWDKYEIPIDIDNAVGVLVLLSYQFIDLQDEQDQVEFEKELYKRYKVAMRERFGNVELLEDDKE